MQGRSFSTAADRQGVAVCYFVDVREIGVGMMEPAKLDDERYVGEQKQEEKLPNEQYQPKVGRPRPRPPIQRRNGFRRSVSLSP